jgi:hypothetical protein
MSLEALQRGDEADRRGIQRLNHRIYFTREENVPSQADDALVDVDELEGRSGNDDVEGVLNELEMDVVALPILPSSRSIDVNTSQVAVGHTFEAL